MAKIRGGFRVRVALYIGRYGSGPIGDTSNRKVDDNNLSLCVISLL